MWIVQPGVCICTYSDGFGNWITSFKRKFMQEMERKKDRNWYIFVLWVKSWYPGDSKCHTQLQLFSETRIGMFAAILLYIYICFGSFFILSCCKNWMHCNTIKVINANTNEYLVYLLFCLKDQRQSIKDPQWQISSRCEMSTYAPQILTSLKGEILNTSSPVEIYIASLWLKIISFVWIKIWNLKSFHLGGKYLLMFENFIWNGG